MTAIWNWIKSEWADPSTHAWLVLAGGTALAYANGQVDAKSAIMTVIGAALGIVIPTGHKP